MAKGLEARIDRKIDKETILNHNKILGDTLGALKKRDAQLRYNNKKGSDVIGDGELDTERINRIVKIMNTTNRRTLRGFDLNYILKVAMLNKKYINYGKQAIGLLVFKKGLINNINNSIVEKFSSMFDYFKEGGKSVILKKTKKGTVKMSWNGKMLVFNKIIENK